MKNINILGFYNTKNLTNNIGDESYKLAFKKLFPQHNLIFSDTVLSNEFDAYILGGGDTLSPHLLEPLKLINKPKFIISASANLGIKIEQSDFQKIIVRDNKSIEILNDKKLKCELIPDIAFLLEGCKDRGNVIIEENFNGLELYNKKVCVILNGYLTDDHSNGFDIRKSYTFQNFAYKLSEVMDYTNASFIFLSFGQSMPWYDMIPNYFVSQKCKFWQKNKVFPNLSVQQTLDVMKACDACISTRLHSTIFSIANKIPFIDIVHNHKNSWLLDTLNLNDYRHDYYSFNMKKCISDLKLLLEKNNPKELDDLLDNLRTQIKRISDLYV